MDLTPNYDTESSPFVIGEDVLNSWPCAHWTLDNWAEEYDQVRFKFRAHRRKCSSEVHWENEADGYVEATVAHLLAHVRAESTATTEAEMHSSTTVIGESSDANPFEAFPTEEYCFYSAYNYMNQLSAAKPSLLSSARWAETGLFPGSSSSTAVNDASKSTLWLGTSGAHTPCHMDTYGYNFVGQLQGRLVVQCTT